MDIAAETAVSTTAAIAAEPAGTHRVPLGGQALQQRLDSLVHLVVDVLHGSGSIALGAADHGPAACLLYTSDAADE